MSALMLAGPSFRTTCRPRSQEAKNRGSLFQRLLVHFLLSCGLPCLLQFDQAYTSVLKRAINTLQVVLENSDQLWIPVEKTWRLNERHYGDLQVGQTPVS